MKEKLKKWLEINKNNRDIYDRLANQDIRIANLEKDLRRSLEYIGALYDYLKVLPKRTFVQDFSQLPPEEFPTIEIIKAVKATKPKNIKS